MAVSVSLHEAIKRESLKFIIPTWWDEDLSRCMLYWQLQQGAVLRVRIDNDNDDMIISLDGKQIKGIRIEKTVKNLIKPLINELVLKVYPLPADQKPNDIWYSRVPGITKIKIAVRYISMSSNSRAYDPAKWYTSHVTQHKMGRNGGKNYHLNGNINLFKNKE